MSIEPLVITLTGEAESAKSAAREVRDGLDGVVTSAKSVGVESAKAAAALAKMDAAKARETATALRATATEAQDVAKKATEAAKALDGADGKKAKEAAAALMQTAKEASSAAKEAEKTAVALERVEASKVREVTQEVGKLAEAERKAKQELDGISNKFREVGEAVPGAKSFQAFQTGVGGMKLQIADVRAAMAEIRNTGMGGKYGPDPALLGRSADAAALLSRNLEGVRNAGIGMAASGTAGLLGLNSFIANSEEGRGVQTREDSLFASQQAKGMRGAGDQGTVDNAIDNVRTKSHASDDDPIREAAVQMASDQVATKDLPDLLEAAARNAETLKTPIDQVGEGMAKAYGELSLSRLTRMNILFDEGAQEAVDAAAAISKTAGQTEFMRQVMASTAKSTGELGSGLTDTQKAANDFSNSFDSLSTNVGAGAGIVKSQVSYLGGALIEVANSAPGLEKVAGGLGYIVSAGLAGGGAVAGLAAHLGQAVLGFNALKAAVATKQGVTLEDTTVTAANSAATVSNSAAQGTNSAAAATNASAKTTLAVAEEEATAAAETNAQAQTANAGATANSGAVAYSSSLEFDALMAAEAAAAEGADTNAISQGAQIAGMEGATAAAAEEVIALDAVTVAEEGVGAAGNLAGLGMIGLIVGVGLFFENCLAKLMGMKPVLKGLSDEMLNIKDKFTGGNEAGVSQDEQDLEAGIKENRIKNAKAVNAGKMKKEDADKANLKYEAEQRENYAKEEFRVGGDEAAMANQDKAAQLRNQMNPPKMPPIPAPAIPGLPTAPAGAAAAPTASVPGVTAPAALAPTTSTSAAAAAPGQVDALTAQIRALEDQKAGLKGKANAAARDALTEQIRQLRRQEQDAKKNQAQANKADKKAEAEAKATAKTQDADDLAIIKAKNDIAAAEKIDALQDQLDDAKEGKNAAEVGRLTYEIAQANAEKEYQDAIAADNQLEDGKHRDTEGDIAELKYRAAEKRALTAGHKAEDAAAKSSGKSDSAKHDTAVRSTLEAFHANAVHYNIGGGSALNPAGQLGDMGRYKEPNGLKGYTPVVINASEASYGGGQMPDLTQSRYQNGAGANDSYGGGSGSSSSGSDSMTAKVSSLNMNSKGQIEVQFEKIVLPYQGLGNLRRRMGI